MTIRPGQSWGSAGVLAAGQPVAEDDRALAQLIENGEVGPFGLLGGDLHRMLGEPGPERMWTDEAMSFPIDVVEIVVDDRAPVVMAAHLVAGGRVLWRGRTVVMMNASSIGNLDLGPRAHPNDGLLDVTDGSLPLRDRRRARRRMPAGTHLPHPMLTTVRARRVEVVFGAPHPVRIDGVSVGNAQRILAEVLPDAATIVV